MNKVLRISLIIILFGLLIAVRGFVAPYFYDPLNEYFKNDYLYGTFPEIKYSTYFLHLFSRYFLNSIISLAIIYFIFQNKELMVFAIKFYVVAFIFLSIGLFILLRFHISEGYMLVFYVRRFLIQPLFVFILLPAFYYQNLKESN